MENNKWIVKTRVSENVYTNRVDMIEYFYNYALKTYRRLNMSTVLLGYRRMGKTEIFKRVVNRLFFEQDKKDPKAVVPVFYTFSDKQQNDIDFITEYLENFLKFYLGFYLDDYELIQQDISLKELKKIAHSALNIVPSQKTLKWLIGAIENIHEFPIPLRVGLQLPRKVSDIDDTSIAMFLDEFQNTKLPQFDFDITGYFHEAADSNTCPHFVTGSAMSILYMEILGAGTLFGRFKFEKIERLTPYYSAELALKLATQYNVEVGKDAPPIIGERCGGNPYYITAVIQQADKLGKSINNIDDLNDILAVDISSGFIWGELCDQVKRWTARINEYHITKWILYLASIEDNDDDVKGNISVNKIQKALKKQEKIDVDKEKIRDILVLLARGDLIEDFTGTFYRIKDPILCDFLKVWGKVELENTDPKDIIVDLQKKYYQVKKKSINEYKGYMAEVHLSQVLLAAKKKKLSGKFFNHNKDITMPDFVYVRHRTRISSGKGREIDLLAGYYPESWVCQSKWVENKKIGVNVLQELLEQAEDVKKDMELLFVKKWIFAHDGLTEDAIEFAKTNEIYWSTRQNLDDLLKYLNLRALYAFS